MDKWKTFIRWFVIAYIAQAVFGVVCGVGLVFYAYFTGTWVP